MSPAARSLAQSLSASLAALAGRPVVEGCESRAWASAGACGERHRLALRTSRQAADALLASLPSREFELGDHIVADVTAVSDERCGAETRLTIEALTIERD